MAALPCCTEGTWKGRAAPRVDWPVYLRRAEHNTVAEGGNKRCAPESCRRRCGQDPPEATVHQRPCERVRWTDATLNLLVRRSSDRAAGHVAPPRRLSHPAHVGARLWTSAGGFAVSVSINTRRISVATRSTWTCSPILPKETSKNSTSLAATAGVCSGQ